MHSSDYIFEGKEMNIYVSEVCNCQRRFNTSCFNTKTKFIFGATSMFKYKAI